ncbi:MAG: hypothetical protein GF416_03755 [Candidatus Altiarchaeales archaeon]|nr:hypothetical protein [Candidatus Altiarchaeales archaeon]MBD3416235.1 hypothetical protein [Candidatus Altiarchaeales archaeon]
MDVADEDQAKKQRILFLVVGAVAGGILGPFMPFINDMFLGSAIGIVAGVLIGTKLIPDETSSNFRGYE